MIEESEDIVSVFVNTNTMGSGCEVEMCTLEEWRSMGYQERADMVKECVWNVLDVHVDCPSRPDLDNEEFCIWV